MRDTVGRFKKGDVILAALIILTAIVFVLLYYGSSKGSEVVIYIGNQEYARHSLDADTVIVIRESGKENVVEIKDGEARMMNANCPDRLCVRQHAIQKGMQTIVCLPNQVIIKIEENQDPDLDAVSH